MYPTTTVYLNFFLLDLTVLFTLIPYLAFQCGIYLLFRCFILDAALWTLDNQSIQQLRLKSQDILIYILITTVVYVLPKKGHYIPDSRGICKLL